MGSAEVDKLRKAAADNAKLADTHRKQRDMLQADWDAREHSRGVDGATVDDASLRSFVCRANPERCCSR